MSRYMAGFGRLQAPTATLFSFGQPCRRPRHQPSLFLLLIRKLGFQGSEARLRHTSIPNADLVYLEVRCEHAVVLCFLSLCSLLFSSYSLY